MACELWAVLVTGVSTLTLVVCIGWLLVVACTWINSGSMSPSSHTRGSHLCKRTQQQTLLLAVQALV